MVESLARLPTLPTSTGAFGVYTGVDALPRVVAFASRHDVPLLVRSTSARSRRPSVGPLPYTFDSAWWQSHVADPRSATEASDAGCLSPISLDDWAANALRGTRARIVLTPSAFVLTADWAALQALVAELATTTHQALLRLVATDGAMLDSSNFLRFKQELRCLEGQPIGFLFGGKRESMARGTRLRNLRLLFQAHPGASLIGVDPLVASDALAHGSGPVFVGASSGLRWPAPPGASNGGFNSKGFLPGIFNRELLSIRSPEVFADWYVNSPSPVCAVCRQPVDDYAPTDADKAAILDHNLHSAHALSLDLMAKRAAARAAWLHDQRVEALLAHQPLSGGVADLAADMTLRRLVELDDPLARRATPAGLLI